MQYPVDIVRMLPDESPYLWILLDGFVRAVFVLVARLWTIDGNIVNEGCRNVRHFWFEDESHASLEFWNCVRTALR